MSSNHMAQLTKEQAKLLNRLSPPTGGIPRFDAEMKEGRLKREREELVYLLDWSDAPQKRALPARGNLEDFFSSQPVTGSTLDLTPHAGRVLRLK